MDQFKADVDMLGNSDDGPRGQTPQMVVVHTSEPGPYARGKNPGTAENLASYENNPANGGSYQVIIDRTGHSVRINDDGYISWSAGWTANKKGVHVCATGWSAQTRDEWIGYDAQLNTLARLIAHACQQYGLAPHFVDPAGLRAGKTGFCGHAHTSAAWGETNHTDPGPNFPWDVLDQKVNAALGGPPTTPVQEDTMADDLARAIKLQLTGSPDVDKYPGWPQLGNHTIVDGLADNRVLLVFLLDQLGGPGTADAVLRGKPQEGFKGWPQLGGKTLVDFLATLAPKAGA